MHRFDAFLDAFLRLAMSTGFPLKHTAQNFYIMQKSLSVLGALLLISLLMACNATNTQPNTNSTGIKPTETASIATVIVPARPNPQPDEPILGLDVSYFQGKVNWSQIEKDGIHFTYAKATQGQGYTDPMFQTNLKGMRASKLYAGAYHFYMSGDDPVKQAENFLKSLPELKIGDMVPMLDLEQGGWTKGTDIATFQANVKIWLKIIEEKLGMKPIIYTNNPFAKTYLQGDGFSQYDLWLAEYGVHKPRVPKPWNKWTIWQRSAKGTYQGLPGGESVDHDLFSGTHVELLNLVKQ